LEIIHLITTINRGGAENQLIQMLSEQCKNHKNISIIYLKGDGYWKSWLQKNSIICFGPIFPNGNYLSFMGLLRLFIILRRFKNYLIHMHMPPSLFLGFIIRFFTLRQSKFIYTSHNDEPIIPNVFLDKLFSRYLLNMPNNIIAISEAVKIFLIKKYNIKSKKITTINYGFDKSTYPYMNKKNHFSELDYLDKKYIYIGTVARLVEQKRIDLLIESFQYFKKEFNLKVKLVIIGSGHLSKSLKNYSLKKGIEDSIIWIDQTNYVLDHMRNWDLFCLTSEYEGFGLVLLEALSVGLPILAMKTSSIKEIIGPCGLVVDYGNTIEFAKAIKEILDKPKKFINKNYIKNFSLKKNMISHFKIYFD